MARHRRCTFGELAFLNCNGLRLFLSKGDQTANFILYFQRPMSAPHTKRW